MIGASSVEVVLPRTRFDPELAAETTGLGVLSCVFDPPFVTVSDPGSTFAGINATIFGRGWKFSSESSWSPMNAMVPSELMPSASGVVLTIAMRRTMPRMRKECMMSAGNNWTKSMPMLDV